MDLRFVLICYGNTAANDITICMKLRIQTRNVVAMWMDER